MSWRLDPFLNVKPPDADGVKWYSPFDPVFRIGGLAFVNENRNFFRLKADAVPEEVTRHETGEPVKVKREDWGVFELAGNPAGAQIQFITDAKKIWLDFELEHLADADRMPPSGASGFDLYVKEEGSDWRLAGITFLNCRDKKFTLPFWGLAYTKKKRQFLIHFPLYNTVKNLAIGLEDADVLEPPPPWNWDKKIVWYGTSITQGGCASTPGMAASNILSRIYNCEICNFGFSGNGRCEPELAHILGSIRNMGAFVIDTDWNMSIPAMKVIYGKFLDIIRSYYPDIPLYIMSYTPGMGCHPLDVMAEESERALWKEKKELVTGEFFRRKAAGDKNIFFIDGSRVLGEDWFNATVDLCHLTSFGYYRQAERIALALLETADSVTINEITAASSDEAGKILLTQFPEIFSGRRSSVDAVPGRIFDHYRGFIHFLYRLAANSDDDLAEPSEARGIDCFTRKLHHGGKALYLSSSSGFPTAEQELILKNCIQDDYMFIMPDTMPVQLDTAVCGKDLKLSLPVLQPGAKAVICPRKELIQLSAG